MKNSTKYWLIVATVIIGATLVSGSAGAVITAPQPGTAVIGSAPMVSPVFGSGLAPAVSLAPKSAGVTFVRPFFKPFFFPFFNPFFFDIDVDPFFGFGEFD